MSRQFPRPIKRLVVKVGSSLITSGAKGSRKTQISSLVSQISTLLQKKIEVVLVSSGAIALGMCELKLAVRPKDVASLQALAAIGQTVLMRTYADLFKKREQICGQVLLTWDDFADRARYNNARNTLKTMLAKKVVPIVNENDTISTEEIKFGDNDKLSAFVASLVHADLLLILSDVEGLYAIKDGKKEVFEEVREITTEIRGVAGGSANTQISKGGMITKLDAVRIATHARIPCVIANGQAKDVLLRVVGGERIGTFFYEKEEKLLARKHWISFGSKPRGTLVVDDGAREALMKGGRSLLLPGIVKTEGDFKANDVVVVCSLNRQEFARGITAYSAAELTKVLQGQEDAGKRGRREVIHCNNLVLSVR